MHHLQPAAEAFDTAADEPFAARRQRARKIFVAAVKENEFDHRSFVGAPHAVGLSRITPRHMIEHVDKNRCDAPLAGIGECRTPRAVYKTDGQMKQNIDKARTGKLADQLRELWPDAVQRARIGKER